jgi:hypothetical protein
MGKSKIAIPKDSGKSRIAEPVADPRGELAAQFIPSGAQVLELGGAASVRRYLPTGCNLQARPLDRFAAAMSAGPDIVVMLDAFETSHGDVFLTQLGQANCPVVLNYRPRDLSDVTGANERLGFYDLTRLFDRFGFRIECSAPLGNGEVMMRLAPAEKLAARTVPTVAVVANADRENFGERLGFANVNALLPPEADVHHLTFDNLGEARERYDLVVVGTGTGLSPVSLTDLLIDVAARGAAAIGIFGMQLRELVARPALERLLDRLDTWFARSGADMLLYGRGRSNTVHLGDWTIDPIPLARSTDAEPLRVGFEIARATPLDRAIRTIQRHSNVISSELHPLLCALTSADLVAYGRPASHIDIEEIRSLLIDIFGRGHPPGEHFLVDRDAVLRYKTRVRTNVALVRERIEAILRNSAVAAAA